MKKDIATQIEQAINEVEKLIQLCKETEDFSTTLLEQKLTLIQADYKKQPEEIETKQLLENLYDKLTALSHIIRDQCATINQEIDKTKKQVHAAQSYLRVAATSSNS